jgi:hypothetical protein
LERFLRGFTTEDTEGTEFKERRKRTIERWAGNEVCSGNSSVVDLPAASNLHSAPGRRALDRPRAIE